MTDSSANGSAASGAGTGDSSAVASLPSAARSSLAVIHAIATAERAQFDHRHTATRRKKAVIYVLSVIMLPLVAGLAWGGYRVGQSVAAGGSEGLLTLVRWYLPLLIAGYGFIGFNEVGNRLLEFEARELVLTTVQDRDLVVGLLVADFREHAWNLVGAALLLGVSFGLGVGSVTVIVVATGAAVLVAVAATLVGYAVGLGAKLLVHRLSISSTVRSVLGASSTVGVFLALTLGGMFVGQSAAELSLQDDVTFAELTPAGSPPIPISYYADLFFVGTPLSEGLGPLALGSAVIIVAAIPASLWATIALAPTLWRLDRTTHSASEPASSETESQMGKDHRREWPWLSTPSGYVADGIVRRACRTPRRLAHLVYYVVAAGLVVANLLLDVSLSAAIGAGLAALGVWLAGAAVCLNPLGEEGSMLDQLVLADYRPVTFVRARMLVGTALGLPLVLTGTALLALETLSVTETILVGGALTVMVPASTGVALGIGTLLPKSEPGRVLEAFEARPPERLAMLAHGLLVSSLAAAAVWLLITDPDPTLRWGGLTVVACSTLLVADGGYRFAVSGVTDYGRPRSPDPIYALELAAGLGLLGLVLGTSLEAVALSFVPLSGAAGFAVVFVAAYVGWAIAGVAYLLSSDRPWAYLDVRVPTGRDARYLALGTAGSLAVYGVVVAAIVLFDAPLVAHSVTDDVAAGGPAFVALMLALLLLVNAPVEEFLFRNVIQKRLAETISDRGAILATAVVFAGVHIPVYFSTDPVAIAVTLAPLAVLAVLWGWLYSETQNVMVPALCHGLYNAVVFAAAYVWVL